ncbi:MAG: ABC transporter permease [Bacteroidia bacterium]|nr:ABC transporter permease [Bacteroidia bacterium]
MRKRVDTISLVFILLAGLLLLFIIAPLVGMFITTTPLSLFDAAKETDVQKSIWLTISTSIAATLIFSFVAIPLAYLLARKNFIFKKIILGIINIPVIIPHSAAGIALLGIISRDTFLGKIADSLGFSFVNNPAGIIVAMAFVSIPYLINAAIDGFINVPERLEKVALTLGASKTKVFFSITLPLAWRSILTGLVMMWGRGLSEFGAVIIIAYHPMITPVMIFERFNSYGLQYAKPVTVLFISICLLIFIAMKLISRKTRNAES